MNHTWLNCGSSVPIVYAFIVCLLIYRTIVLKLEIKPALLQDQFKYVEYVKNNYYNKEEKRHIAFLKVHKTGSSTAQNIFLRFGQHRNLTFILSHDEPEVGEERGLPNVISFKNSLNDRNIVPPPKGSSYDISCCHVIYKRSQFEKYLPNDTIYIGSVREPTERLESAINYFKLFRHMSLSEYANNPYRYNHYVGSMTNNRMAFEFGFPSSVFRKTSESKLNKNDFKIINDYLDKIQSEFDVILIRERFNHSIILMKRILRWHIKDVLYISKQVSSKGKRLFHENENENIMSYLNLDYMLYKSVLEEFNNKTKRAGNDFEDEANNYVQVLDRMSNFCKYENSTESIYMKSSKWDSAFNVTKMDCRMYMKPEIAFVQDIRKRQYGQINN